MPTRRTFLTATAATAAVAALGPARAAEIPHPHLVEATLSGLARASALDLVRQYAERIEATNTRGPELRAVLELNPDAEAIAAALDAERAAGRVRSPLHGIPILVKDNFDTADRMQTTAGSLALLGSTASADATAVAKLRAAGAVILGKTNLSEWANIRSTRSSSGWSARGGQCRNPTRLDRSPSGSSSGSAVAVAANLCAVALGSETDGSVVSPSQVNGIVGVKPTVGLVSGAGIIPIAHSQDTAGVHARTVSDAHAVLAILAGPDPRDPTTAAAPPLGPLREDALRGARIGVPRKGLWGYDAAADAAAERALSVLAAHGAVIVDPADLPAIDAISGDDELLVLLTELVVDLAAYLSTRTGGPKSLAEIVAFNNAHAAEEMPFFGQELFEQALATGGLGDPKYRTALARNRKRAREHGIDAALRRHQLDALVCPAGGAAWTIDHVAGDQYTGGCSTPSAVAGYPIVTVPFGEDAGLPLGLAFLGTAWSDTTLLRLAYGFELATRERRAPGLG